jgi:hypothetical protein
VSDSRSCDWDIGRVLSRKNFYRLPFTPPLSGRQFGPSPGNAYILKTLLGEEFTAAINGRYLKKYYPSIEVDH